MKRSNAVDDDDNYLNRKSTGRGYLLKPDLGFFRQEGSLLQEDGVEYKLNSYGLRSDNFQSEHSGLHILFAGCSNTFGLGTDLENIWATRVYNKIKKTNHVSNYNNIGINAGSIIEIVFHIFRYIEKFGNPDVVFILLPERDRDDEFFFDEHEEAYSDSFNFSIYHSLELFCRSNNIRLISSTWVSNYTSLWDSFSSFANYKGPNPQKILLAPKIRNEKTMFDDYLNNFKTFKNFYKDKIIEDLYEYSVKNPKDKNMYTAKDRGRHFGNAFHYAWSNQLHERFLNEKDN
jgi:hypothetical protein